MKGNSTDEAKEYSLVSLEALTRRHQFACAHFTSHSPPFPRLLVPRLKTRAELALHDRATNISQVSHGLHSLLRT
jgi:hypothetical protein